MQQNICCISYVFDHTLLLIALSLPPCLSDVTVKALDTSLPDPSPSSSSNAPALPCRTVASLVAQSPYSLAPVGVLVRGRPLLSSRCHTIASAKKILECHRSSRRIAAVSSLTLEVPVSCSTTLSHQSQSPSPECSYSAPESCTQLRCLA
ncbi:hypothetical protein B296_00028551 [Ensete ventricosum]|uniref:Uncharacterized protein n=1 Tax=Ensete ventricosum TaxID=4639 RepID=A0A427A003_ENSVE|nr:hypothetical protein B296_00028551 [Ensete ventricosum]